MKSIVWLPIICLTLNLSHDLSVIDFGKLITFPLNVTLISLQSISRISHTYCLFNFTLSAINLPVILNKCKLPAVLHNFTSM